MYAILFVATYVWAGLPTYLGLTRNGASRTSAALQAFVWPYTAWLAIKQKDEADD